MSEIAKILLSLVSLAALLTLIVAKTDKQLIHLLEGGLFKLNKDLCLASPTYRSNRSAIHVIFFVTGWVVLIASVLIIMKGMYWGAGVLVLSLIPIFLGVRGRLKSFRASKQKLGLP